jgi:hypothetical protein
VSLAKRDGLMATDPIMAQSVRAQSAFHAFLRYIDAATSMALHTVPGAAPSFVTRAKRRHPDESESPCG